MPKPFGPKTIRLVSERLNSTDDLIDMLTIIEAFLVGIDQSLRKHLLMRSMPSVD